MRVHSTFLVVLILSYVHSLGASLASAVQGGGNAGARAQPEPKRWEFIIKVWNAELPPLKRCKDGLMPAIASLMKIDPDKLGFLGSILGSLNPPRRLASDNSGLPSFAEIYHSLSQEFNASSVAFRARSLASGKLSSQAYSSSLLLGEFEHMGKNMEQLVTLGVAAGIHQTIHAAKNADSTICHDTDFNDEEAEDTLQQQPNVSRSFCRPSFAAKRKLGFLDSFKDMPGALMSFLSSKTFATFVDEVAQFVSAVPLQIASPRINVLTAACDAVEYTGKYDVVPVKRQCLISNILMAVMTCTQLDYAFDKLECPNLVAKVEALDGLPPSVCNPTAGPHNGEQVGQDGYTPVALLDLLSDGKTLPETLPREVTVNEELTYYYFYRASSIVYMYSKAAACGDVPVPEVLPGWETIHILRIREEGEAFHIKTGQTSVPIAFVLRDSKNPCSLAIVIRQTISGFEWRVNIMTNMRVTLRPKVMAHSGFLLLVNSMAPTLDAIFASFFADCPCVEDRFNPRRPRVVVTGHSFGAGVGQLLSLHLAERYPCLAVDAVLIACPRTLNQAGAQLWGRKVNGRTLAFDMDPVAFAPCTLPGGFLRCDVDHSLLPTGYGFDYYVQTPGVHVYEFQTLEPAYGLTDPNSVFLSVLLSASGMKGNYTLPSAFQVVASHVCAYACQFGKSCDSSMDWMCTTDTCTGWRLPGMHPIDIAIGV